MAAEIEKEWGISCDLIGGGNGVYDVVLDGATIFSKGQVGRFPNDGEIAQAIRNRG